MEAVPASLASRFAAVGTAFAVLEEGRVVWSNASFDRLFGASVGAQIHETMAELPASFFAQALAKSGPRVTRLEREKGPRRFVYEVEIVHTPDAVGVIVLDQTRVAERELIVSSFGKKLERVNRRLEGRNELMRTLLDHADDGFFGLDRRGHVLSEMAAVVPTLVGHDPRGGTLAEMLPGENGRAIADLLALALDESIPEALLHESLDYDWKIGGRVLRLGLTPLSDDAPARVLGKLRDVTAERREACAQRERADYQALVTAAVHHPEHFEIARGEIAAFADALQEEREADRQQLLISVHTIKATTRAYRMEGTTSRLHDLETRLGGDGADARAEVVTAVLELHAQFSEVGRLLGAEGMAQVVKVDRSALGALTREVARLEGGAGLARGLRGLLLQPLQSELGGLEAVARGTARDRAKEVRVELDAEGIRVDRLRLRPLLAVLPHLVRNAVAHGIELPGTRVQAGKPAAGLVDVRASLHETEACMRLWVEDDGAGVDRERLAALLEARGHDVAVHTDDQVLAALCLPELSTAQEADLHAGRGVGMSAVANEVAKLGGRLSLSTTRGEGTRFTIELPIDHADPVAVRDVPRDAS